MTYIEPAYANNKGAYQPVHPCILISPFVICCLDSIIPLVSISEVSSLYLASGSAVAQWWSVGLRSERSGVRDLPPPCCVLEQDTLLPESTG